MTVWLWWWSKVHTFWHEKIHLEAKCSKKPCSVLLGSCAPHGYRAWNRLMKFNAESLKECCPIVKGCPFVKIQENKSLEIGSWKRASHTPTRASYLSQYQSTHEQNIKTIYGYYCASMNGKLWPKLCWMNESGTIVHNNSLLSLSNYLHLSECSFNYL